MHWVFAKILIATKKKTQNDGIYKINCGNVSKKE